MPRADNARGDSALRLQVSPAGVVKSYSDAVVARQEWLKSVDASALSRRSGLFTTPRVLEHEEMSTVWEYLEGLRPLRVQLSQGRNPADLITRVGRILAEIHNNLGANPGDPASDLMVDEIRGIHGDFSLNNVQVRAGGREIVVLDWSLAPWIKTTAGIPPQHLDIAVFLVDLFYQRPRDPLIIKRPRELAGSFLSGYCELRTPQFERLAGDIANIMLQYLKGSHQGWRRGLRIPSLGGLMAFVLRVSRSEGNYVQLS